MYNNKLLIKSFIPTGVMPPFSPVKFGSDDGTVTLATSATDLVIGITNELAVVQADLDQGQMVDVVLGGIAEATAGAAFAQGVRLMVNSSSQLITAAAATGANVQVTGIAMAAAAEAGDIIPVLLQFSIMQGA